MAASEGGSSSAFRQLVSYALFGCVCSTVDVAVFWCLTTFLALAPLLANVVSVACGLTLSFLLNRRFTFRVSDRPGRRYLVFIGVGLCGMSIQELVIALLTSSYALAPLFAKLVALVSAGLMQFALNRTVTFRAS